MSAIDVRVTGGGTITNGELKIDSATDARCGLCARDVEATAAIAATFVCAQCLRERLDAMSVARFRLREWTSSLPWGKVTG
jgi:hypothetical protein